MFTLLQHQTDILTSYSINVRENIFLQWFKYTYFM